MDLDLIRPSLAAVGRALGIGHPTMSARMQRGEMRGVAAKKKPGPGQHLTAPQVLEFIWWEMFDRLEGGNKLIAERAAAATRATLPIVLAAVRGELKEPPGYLLAISGKGEQSRVYCKDMEEVGFHTMKAFAEGRGVLSLAVGPAIHKFFEVYKLALDDLARRKGEAPDVALPPTMSALTTGKLEEEVGPAGVMVQPIQTEDPRAIGLNLSRDGLAVFRKGQGLQITLPPHLLRELARRAEALALEIEAEAPPKFADWSIGNLTGTVAGNA